MRSHGGGCSGFELDPGQSYGNILFPVILALAMKHTMGIHGSQRGRFYFSRHGDIAEEDSLKLQNDQLKATVCELMDSMRRLFDDRDRLNHLVKEREQDIEKLEKKLKELSDDSKYCKTCKYYDAPHCTGVPSYDPRMVSPTYTCKDWQPKESV